MREAVLIVISLCGAYYFTLVLIALIKLCIYGVRLSRCVIAVGLPGMFFYGVHTVIKKEIADGKITGMKPSSFYWRTTLHFMSIMPIGMDYVARGIAEEQEVQSPTELSELTRHSAERMIEMGIVCP